jgi:hypothetical protein
MLTVTSTEAENGFGKLLDNVQDEPITIIRDGRIAAFMVSPQDMQNLQEARQKRGDAVEAFEAFFANNDTELAPEALLLTESTISQLVHQSR